MGRKRWYVYLVILWYKKIWWELREGWKDGGENGLDEREDGRILRRIKRGEGLEFKEGNWEKRKRKRKMWLKKMEGKEDNEEIGRRKNIKRRILGRGWRMWERWKGKKIGRIFEEIWRKKELEKGFLEVGSDEEDMWDIDEDDIRIGEWKEILRMVKNL